MEHSLIHEQFDPLDLHDPFPLLADARTEAPIFYNEEINYWIVTRYDDIKAIFRQHDIFTAENTITPIVPFSEQVQTMLRAGNYTPQPVLSNNVPPSHTRIRNIVNKLFLPRRMQSFADAIRNIAQTYINNIIDKRKVDIVETLTYEFSAQILFHVLGVPEADVPQVKAWAGNRIKLYYGKPTAEEQIQMTQNLVPFWHYTTNLVAQKEANPQDDLTSDLIRMRNGDDSILTLNEIASCMITLLVAGHETTTAQITNGILHWLNEPDKWQELVEQPQAIPNAIEEMLRYDPSVCTWRRFVRQETEINGVTVPEGANLLLMLNSANRDERVFSKADWIDIHRQNVKDHLAFGYGIHYCVGAPLARLEMIILFEELTQRLPTMRLIPDQTLDYTRHFVVRYRCGSNGDS